MRFYTTVVSRLILRRNRIIYSLPAHSSPLLSPLSVLSIERPFSTGYYNNSRSGSKKSKRRKKSKSEPDTDVIDWGGEEWPQFADPKATQPVTTETFTSWLTMEDQPKQKQEQKQKQKQEPRSKNDRGKRPRTRDADAAPKQQNTKPGNQTQPQKKPRKRDRDMTSGTSEQVLEIDIKNLTESLNKDENGSNDETNEAASEKLSEEGSEIEVDVVELSSTGDGLAIQKGSKRVYTVPFSIPGDTVKVKVYRHMREGYTIADFISVVKPSPSRDDSRIQCKYFSTCSGCQFQMLDYDEQLRLKKRIVEKAFKNFSQLPPELIPAVQDTIGSPMQYGYRTKLTPHFDGPTGWRKTKASFKECPPIGFMEKGKRTTMDIEDCPIGTDAVRLGMKSERERMAREYRKYVRGATILLRETTQRIPKKPLSSLTSPLDSSTTEPPGSRSPSAPVPDGPHIRVETPEYTEIKTFVTDNNGMSTEYVGPYVFHNPAGSFFQNNNSILPVFTSYVRSHILPPNTTPSNPSDPNPPITHLIDAYSGSGLFTITLSPVLPGGSVGVDVADASIQYATRNARANKLSANRARFIAADAKALFTPLICDMYPADQTAVVLDPPRKGCDADFLRQLMDFAPRRIVYVSCNVHTQARDVGMLVRGEVETTEDCAGGEGDNAGASVSVSEGKKKTRYAIESLRGFDFFPQTGHVEGVCVLSRVDE
ncbi:S-adenosyl-L-methionine-dependent methyltransferase [Rostrohypoxylon terebratum]|nr:S-adenosyl-L-methionine-dependent methyltransferase [Rostrohypoxylon terebratum]